MTRGLFILAIALALSGHAASAQAPKAAATAAVPARLPAGWTAAKIPAPAPTTRVPFGCNARASNICHFRIFYTRGDRIVILAAGMKEKRVPAIVGGDYCIALDEAPAYKCKRKVVNDKYNS